MLFGGAANASDAEGRLLAAALVALGRDALLLTEAFDVRHVPSRVTFALFAHSR
jgi:hypothetical protein